MLDSFHYERQIPSPTERRCGAAALCMVLRDFGVEVSQEEIWDEIKTPVPNKPGEFRIETYRLAAFARKRGVEAIVGRLRQPLVFLESLRCERGYRFILNHRVRADSSLGHFTVFVKVESDAIFLHDPQKGPNQEISRTELAELWKPIGQNCEISGHVGVLFFRTDVDNLSDTTHWSAVFDPETGRQVLYLCFPSYVRSCFSIIEKQILVNLVL